MQAKGSQSQDSQQDSNFGKIFDKISSYSREQNVSLESSFISILNEIKSFQLHKEDLDDATLAAAIKAFFKPNLASKDDKQRKAHKVWVACGETGMGKSSFINAVMNKKIAIEAQKRSQSETSEVGSYDDQARKLCVIDTPGLCDTRPEISDKVILEQICDQVQRKLQVESKIDALLLFWAPTIAQKFRLSILENLKKTFGDGVLESMILVVNKHSKLWEASPDFEESFEEVNEEVKKLYPNLPIVVIDVKTIGSDKLYEAICNEAGKVKLFKEEHFLEVRREACLKIYENHIKRLKEDEELAERIHKENQKIFAKEQQKHQEEIDDLTKTMNNLDLQVAKQRQVISSQENETQKLKVENQRMGYDLKQHKQEISQQQWRHDQEIKGLNNNYNALKREVEKQQDTIESQKREIRRAEQNKATPSFTYAPTYPTQSYTPTYNGGGGAGRCWGCGGGPGHPWSSNCRGGF